MPRAVLEIDEEGVKKQYTKNLNAEEMIVLIKDKFTNWKDLVSFIFAVLFEEVTLFYRFKISSKRK